MIDWSLFAAGVVIGVAVAAPIGPINLMAIRNALAGGFGRGLATGAGAVLGDGTFALVAAFGLSAVAEFVLDYAFWIQLVGGLALIVVGLHAMRAPRPGLRRDGAPSPPGTPRGRTLALVGTTYLLTITNPATMMGFIAIFSGVGGLVARPGDYGAAATMVAAVMAGSLLWWLVLAWVTTRLQSRMDGRWLVHVSRGAGAVIALFGLGVLLRLVWTGA